MFKIIIIAAGTVAVTVGEHASHVAHAPEKTRILVGIAMALPFLIVLALLTWREARAKAKAAAAAASSRRPSYTLSSQMGRRR